MNKEKLLELIVESLKAIEDQYRRPYETRPYERIICYEFYHQLRRRMDKSDCSFVLHGELNKQYRNIKKVPDFIFHVPHTDEGNFAVIEFKNVRSGVRWIKQDLEKLDEFRDFPLSYQVGILVIFGEQKKLDSMQHKLEPYDQNRSELEVVFYDLASGKVIGQLSLNRARKT